VCVKHGREVILAGPDSSIPQRGEIWLVNFDPTKGTEIRKVELDFSIVDFTKSTPEQPVHYTAPSCDNDAMAVVFNVC
jgi:hypothetical protein